MRRLAALAGVIGLSLVGNGCATAALYFPPEGLFPPGLPRQEVEGKLGKPDVSRPLPDGSRADTYTYRLRNLKHRRTATFRYDQDDVLLDHAPPPGYGPPDDSLPPLSFHAIRERCRSEEPAAGRAPAAGGAPPDRAYGYYACIVKRLAIWGVE